MCYNIVRLAIYPDLAVSICWNVLLNCIFRSLRSSVQLTRQSNNTLDNIMHGISLFLTLLSWGTTRLCPHIPLDSPSVDCCHSYRTLIVEQTDHLWTYHGSGYPVGQRPHLFMKGMTIILSMHKCWNNLALVTYQMHVDIVFCQIISHPLYDNAMNRNLN